MPHVDIGGYRTHYFLDDYCDPWAEPETILLQHGYCRSARLWYAWVPTLARQFRVLRPDVRGCGDSPPPGQAFVPNLDNLAADVVALLDALQVRRVHYVGESFGGVVGLQLAYAHPDRVASLTVCNSPSRLQPELQRDNSFGYPDFASAIDAVGLEEWCRRTIDLRLDQHKASPALTEFYCREVGKADSDLAKRWAALTKSIDFTPRLAEVKVPVLLLAPGRSRITSLAQQRLMAEMIPRARLEVVDDVGHGLSFIEPERCAGAVRRFIEEEGRRPK